MNSNGYECHTWEWAAAASYPELREHCDACADCGERGYRPRMNATRLLMIAMRSGPVVSERMGVNVYEMSVMPFPDQVGKGSTITEALANLCVNLVEPKKSI